MSQETPYENLEGYKLALGEMKFYLSQQYEAIDSMKRIAQQMLSASSLVIGLIGAIQVFTAKIHPDFQNYYTYSVILIVALYVFQIFCCIKAIFPLSVKNPVVPEVNALYDGYAGVDDLKAYRQALVNYVDAGHVNEPIIQARRKWTERACILLPIIIGLLLLLNFFPKN